MIRPSGLLGLHHVALWVSDLDAAKAFYVDLLGFRVEWEPDPDNLYLTSGMDNIALHRRGVGPGPDQILDHIGICVVDASAVEAWHDFLKDHGVRILAPPRRHRDGAHSFYCSDPEGIRIQVIHHPPITRALAPRQRDGTHLPDERTA